MSRRVGRCEACEDEVEGEIVGGLLRCLVCGNVLGTPSSAVSEAPQAPLNAGEALERMISRMGPSKAASKRALTTLRRVKPDARSSTLDPQVRLRVEGIDGDCIAVPASFGPLVGVEEREIALRECVPRYAETLAIQCDLKGAWALVDRGGDVSFAFKLHACEKAGALGVLLVQTQDIWPFTPADAKNEASQWGGARIPLVAVSKATGLRLHELIAKSGGETKMKLSLLAGEADRICAVCHDDLVDSEASELIQMPCLHYFHSHCVLPWLENNHTCPVCRFALETDHSAATAGPGSEAPTLLGWFG